ncbi:hypothetical protein CUMW_139770 [Citrus unshiu]|nr:hypothetical protein CUMW_139770 [Citrus unshiu]
MLEQQIGDIELNLVFWVFVNFIVRFFSGMRNSTDGPKPQNGVVSRSTKSPFRAISSYFRIVSSGASTVARSAVSVASSIVERDDESSHDQSISSFEFECVCYVGVSASKESVVLAESSMDGYAAVFPVDVILMARFLLI